MKNRKRSDTFYQIKPLEKHRKRVLTQVSGKKRGEYFPPERITKEGKNRHEKNPNVFID